MPTVGPQEKTVVPSETTAVAPSKMATPEPEATTEVLGETTTEAPEKTSSREPGETTSGMCHMGRFLQGP